MDRSEICSVRWNRISSPVVKAVLQQLPSTLKLKTHLTIGPSPLSPLREPHPTIGCHFGLKIDCSHAPKIFCLTPFFIAALHIPSVHGCSGNPSICIPPTNDQRPHIHEMYHSGNANWKSCASKTAGGNGGPVGETLHWGIRKDGEAVRTQVSPFLDSYVLHRVVHPTRTIVGFKNKKKTVS